MIGERRSNVRHPYHLSAKGQLTASWPVTGRDVTVTVTGSQQCQLSLSWLKSLNSQAAWGLSHTHTLAAGSAGSQRHRPQSAVEAESLRYNMSNDGLLLSCYAPTTDSAASCLQCVQSIDIAWFYDTAPFRTCQELLDRFWCARALPY